MSLKSPTAMLREDHVNVLQKLDALETVLNRLDKQAEISAQLQELAAFFKTDFWVHFAKEEEALFPEMEKFMPRDSGPIGIMLMEHEDLRTTNAEFQRLLPVYLKEPHNAEVREMLKKNGVHFITVLRDHIYKENNILFTMAEMHLDKAQMEKVAALFAKIETAQHTGAA